MLARFASPRKTGEGAMEVLYPVETLHALITAARLSPGNEARWRETVDANRQLPLVWELD